MCSSFTMVNSKLPVCNQTCQIISICLFVLPQARYRKEQVLPKSIPWIPPVDNLLKDSTDGCALAALLHFYCPATVGLEGTYTCQTFTVRLCVGARDEIWAKIRYEGELHEMEMREVKGNVPQK